MSDDLTLDEMREVLTFVENSLEVVRSHSVIYLSHPNHDCERVSLEPGTMMTDIQLRSFFALEDSMHNYIKVVRDALIANGQLDVEDVIK